MHLKIIILINFCDTGHRLIYYQLMIIENICKSCKLAVYKKKIFY